MTNKQKKLLIRIGISAVLLIAAYVFSALTDLNKYIYLATYAVPYLVAGYDILCKSVRNILHGNVFDENFLMSIATVGALATGEYPEAVFVMVFFQTGEFFQSYAVEKSRRSIASLMDIRPDSARVIRDGAAEEVLPEEVAIGETIIVNPGEKIPLDGIIIAGESALDTAALTGEALPRDVKTGDDALSGCINISGVIRIRVTKEFGESTVSKILELVENSGANKARSENFITKFAHYYTPAVVICAALLAVVPSIITGNMSDWVYRALIFLVVSCPCALVISVPLSFFGGLGGASSKGVLVKGANYLEALAKTSTVVFDKTGTLTSGSFYVSDVFPSGKADKQEVLQAAASAEHFSSHPIAVSIKNSVQGNYTVPESGSEKAGYGVSAVTSAGEYSVGNYKYMEYLATGAEEYQGSGTPVYVAKNNKYLGCVIISDEPKKTAEKALKGLHENGVKKTVMLTGDTPQAARGVAEKLGIDSFYASLLPQDKVSRVEQLCNEKDKKTTVVFVGDGINDAPVLARADVGVAMGGLGSDAAIEAADAVIMDDDPDKLNTVIGIARKTLRIVYENVVFALVIKFGVLAFAAFGLTNMWVGVLADVGVAVIAILNAMRCMKVK